MRTYLLVSNVEITGHDDRLVLVQLGNVGEEELVPNLALFQVDQSAAAVGRIDANEVEVLSSDFCKSPGEFCLFLRRILRGSCGLGGRNGRHRCQG